MRKKVCILQNDLAFGGTDTFVLNLCRGLVQDGNDVTVVLSIDKNQVSKREPELEDIGVKVRKTASVQNGAKSKIKHFILLYKELRKERYDVFQTNIDLFNGINLFVAWLARIPIRECHSHNSQQSRELQYGRTLLVRIYQKVMRWCCWTFSNRRGGCSNQAMDFLYEKRWKNDVHSQVVHNGIDLSAYNREFDKNQKKNELGIKKQYHICTVGRIDYQKNPMFIVEVMRELFGIRDDCDFTWIGVGNMENMVYEKVKQYHISDKIHLIGRRTDVPEILACMDLFFLPSNFEGLGIVLIEAQAAGVPCVTSTTIPNEADCGAMHQISMDKGPYDWAQEISTILDGNHSLHVDPLRLNEYSIEHMVKEMEALFV